MDVPTLVDPGAVTVPAPGADPDRGPRSPAVRAADDAETPVAGGAPVASGVTVLAATGTLAGCGGASLDALVPAAASLPSTTTATTPSSTPGAGTPAPGTTTPAAPPPTQKDAARFLLQAQFSASDEEIAAVMANGYGAWFDAQLAAPTDQTAWDWLNAKGYNVVADATRYYDSMTPSWFMAWRQLIASRDGVRKRLALALSEYFVVSGISVEVSWRSHAMAAWWDLLNRAVTGNFRQVLEEVTLNPAMGFYLNTKGNQKENASTGRAPDENYAREVMQLFTIGLAELNPDGTSKLVGGKPVETYTLDDVTNLARVFTGYDLDPAGSNDGPFTRGSTATDGNVADPQRLRSRMKLNPSLHSPLASTFLGTTIPANTDGATALRIALDRLFNHPNLAPFFSRQMIQRLVTSNPSPAYVQRAAAVFANNGRGVRGDIAAVFRAILLDPEARSADGLASPTFGKVREPMVRFVQWARTFGATSADDGWKLYNYSDPGTSLGQQPLWAPSVFNYFRPGFVPPQTSVGAATLTNPEFQIVSETSVAGYLNFMQTAVLSGISSAQLKAAYTKELPLASNPAALVDRLDLLLTAGQLDADVKTRIAGAVAAMPAPTTTAATTNRVAAAVFMVMACPAYIVQQ
ncbi:MAG: DUF1800 domain-containing protein [Burkholderiales bacterium]|jgi:uncharacterized protein (DUF1800 family)